MAAPLIEARLIEHEPDTARFHLGFDLFDFGTKAAATRERTGDTVFLSLRSGTEAVCVDRREGSFPGVGSGYV